MEHQAQDVRGTGDRCDRRAASRRSVVAAVLPPTMSQFRFMTTAGYGSCWARIASSARRTGARSGSMEARLTEHRREARGEEKGVALPEGDGERLREVKDHVAAGLGPSRLQEAQVSRRDLGLDREGELAHLPRLPPVLERADRWRESMEPGRGRAACPIIDVALTQGQFPPR